MSTHDDEALQREIVQYCGYNEEIVNNPVLKSIRRIDFKRLITHHHEHMEITTAIAKAAEKMMNIDPN